MENELNAAISVLFDNISVQESADKYSCSQTQILNTLKRIRQRLNGIQVSSQPRPLRFCTFLLTEDQAKLVKEIEKNNKSKYEYKCKAGL